MCLITDARTSLKSGRSRFRGKAWIPKQLAAQSRDSEVPQGRPENRQGIHPLHGKSKSCQSRRDGRERRHGRNRCVPLPSLEVDRPGGGFSPLFAALRLCVSLLFSESTLRAVRVMRQIPPKPLSILPQKTFLTNPLTPQRARRLQQPPESQQKTNHYLPRHSTC
jgi:hypothetical protein